MVTWVTPMLGVAAWDSTLESIPACIIDARILVDREGNNAGLVSALVEEAVEHIRSGRPVVVCCDYGLSRSPAVASAVLARTEDCDFQHALDRVRRAVGTSEQSLDIVDAARSAAGDIATSEQEDSDRSVLVLGGTGFVGRHVAAHFPAGTRYSCPSRRLLDLSQHPDNLDQFVMREGVGTILHLAHPHIYTSNSALAEAVLMTKNVLDVAARRRVRVVYVSSLNAVYGGYHARELRATEGMPTHPLGTYGQAKHLCEVLVDLHRRDTGLPTLILRPSAIYGADGERPKFIWTFVRAALSGGPLRVHEYRNGFQTFDLLHIDDAARAFALASISDVEGVLHLGTGVGKSVRDVASQIIMHTSSGSRIEYVAVDAWIGNTVAEPGRAQDALGWAARTTFEGALSGLVQAPGLRS